MTEGEIKLEICQFLERYPDRILFTITPPKRTKYSSKFMRNGWPDIYGVVMPRMQPIDGIYPAVPFFIEVKKPGGTLSQEQFQILTQAKAWNAITGIATCVTDVREILGL